MRANDDELRASIGETYRDNILWFDHQESKNAFQTLIRQCCLAPSCGGQVPYRGEDPGPEQWNDVPRGTMDEVSSHVRLDLPLA
jgi:hypothetical protein